MDLARALCVVVLRVGRNVTNKAVTIHGVNKFKKMYKLVNL